MAKKRIRINLSRDAFKKKKKKSLWCKTSKHVSNNINRRNESFRKSVFCTRVLGWLVHNNFNREKIRRRCSVMNEFNCFSKWILVGNLNTSIISIKWNNERLCSLNYILFGGLLIVKISVSLELGAIVNDFLPICSKSSFSSTMLIFDIIKSSDPSLMTEISLTCSFSDPLFVNDTTSSHLQVSQVLLFIILLFIYIMYHKIQFQQNSFSRFSGNFLKIITIESQYRINRNFTVFIEVVIKKFLCASVKHSRLLYCKKRKRKKKRKNNLSGYFTF